MKKFIIPLLFVAFFVAIMEQSKENPNVYILTLSVIIFIYGMIRLSAKTPSKHEEDQMDNKEEDNDKIK